MNQCRTTNARASTTRNAGDMNFCGFEYVPVVENKAFEGITLLNKFTYVFMKRILKISVSVLKMLGEKRGKRYFKRRRKDAGAIVFAIDEKIGIE